MKLTPKNWKSFQHYKDRAPPWIKLHKTLLDDFKFASLPVASRALAPCLWLLASEYDGGEINASLTELAFRLHMTEGEVAEALQPLLESGFFGGDSGPLATRKQETRLETETQVETQEQAEVEAAKAAPQRKLATRLPDDWGPSDGDFAFAQKEGLPILEIELEATKFRNYWTAKSGKDATKLNWSRTWENWILNRRTPRGANGKTTRNGLGQALEMLGDNIRETDRSEEGGQAVAGLLPDGRRERP